MLPGLFFAAKGGGWRLLAGQQSVYLVGRPEKAAVREFDRSNAAPVAIAAKGVARRAGVHPCAFRNEIR